MTPSSESGSVSDQKTISELPVSAGDSENWEKTVLAVQSHVVHGYVGNRAATLPLQLRGWEVDALNTVEFSNHTGYGSFKGRRTTASDVEDLWKGLKAQDFTYGAFLTGYLPSAAVVEAITEIGRDLRACNPELVWLLDPVLGDEGRLYVAEDAVPAYKRLLKSGLATIVTPNDFEVELLTGIPLVDDAAVLKALRVLHNEFHVPYVVISSISRRRILADGKEEDELVTIGSSAESGVFTVTAPKFDSYFTGTGDLFAALMLDNFWSYRKTPNGMQKAVAATVGALRVVLARTWTYGQRFHGGRTKIADKTMKYHELRLVECRRELMDPSESVLQWKPMNG